MTSRGPRVIALNLLDGGDPPDEAGVRRAAEIAVQAVRAQGPGSEIDTVSPDQGIGGQRQCRGWAGLHPHG